MPFVEKYYIYEMPAPTLLLRPVFDPVLVIPLKMPTASAAENQGTAGLQGTGNPQQ